MTKHPNRKRLRKRRTIFNGCSGKKRFSLESATQAATKMIAKRLNERYYIYLCKHGSHYHVSKSSGKDWVRIVELDQECSP